jgi:hypothetical protein
MAFPGLSIQEGRDPAGDVLCLTDDTTVGRRHVSEVGAALHPRRDGGAVLGIGRGFAPDGACTSSAGAVRERGRGGGAIGPRRWWPAPLRPQLRP